MIMAAGVGSRLMPMTRDVPKPMIPMANVPLMVNTVNLLQKHGFTDLIANLHHQANHISSYFGNGQKFGVNLHYSPEEALMGTAGGVKRCQWFLDDTFIVVSGDALTDIDLKALLHAHRRKGALATIALKEVQDVEQFGIVITDPDGRIKNFQEKPRLAEALSCVANTGIYVFEPEIFKLIPAGQFYDFGKELFPLLVQIGSPFYGAVVDGYWCDVGNLITYRQAHADIMNGKVKARQDGSIITGKSGGQALVATGTKIGSQVTFNGNVVMGADCRIGDNVVIENSVIWERTIVEAGARIIGAIIGDDCVIRAGRYVPEGSVLANGSKYTD
jgi:mannose-1-phosphate guanylyltransferase